MERLSDEPEYQPLTETQIDITPQFFLSHDTLRLLEDEVWLDYQERVDRGAITPDQAAQLFIQWRAGYIDAHDL